jgi:aminopeptidase YwaD
MSARSGFMCALLFGLFLIGIGRTARVGFAEALVLSSATALLLLNETLQSQRRTNAIEQFLTRVHERVSAPIAPSRLLEEVPMAEEVADRLRFHLNRIIGERHPKTSRQHHDHVRDLIADHFGAMGWDVRVEKVVGPHGPGANVIAERRSSNSSAAVLIVGAHYDTVQGTPGADDNGIAVAGIMALAEILRNDEFEHTIRLVAWDLEEQQGFGRCLLGSRQMARNIVTAHETILGVVCLEMIGMCDHRIGSQQAIPGLRWLAPDVYKQVFARQSRGDFIATVGNTAADELAVQFAESAKRAHLPSVRLTNSGFVRLLRDLRRSDHAPFWDAGIPAIMVTDTSNFRSPFYHTALDRVEMIDFEFAAKVIQATADSIRKTALNSPGHAEMGSLSCKGQIPSTNPEMQSVAALSQPPSI